MSMVIVTGGGMHGNDAFTSIISIEVDQPVQSHTVMIIRQRFSACLLAWADNYHLAVRYAERQLHLDSLLELESTCYVHVMDQSTKFKL